MFDLLFVFAVLLPLLLLGSGFTAQPLFYLGARYGNQIRGGGDHRKQILLERVEKEKEEQNKLKSTQDEEWEQVEQEKTGTSASDAPTATHKDQEWNGIVGFFHPFCNAGGGGERVLWRAVDSTQQRWPRALCIVYTGDTEVNKDQILARVKDRFNIALNPPTIVFLYLSTRRYVLSSTWPHFTLLGQSLGSILLAHDAFSLLVPDIFIDTMGYAFALAYSKLLFPDVPTAAYVHYPTISTDMLESLDEGGQGVNAGAGTGIRGMVKRAYWHLFAWIYGKTGSTIDIVMTNSSWTQDHVQKLWSPGRTKHPNLSPIEVVFPPVAVEEVAAEVEVDEPSESARRPNLLYIAQFRPEKNHTLIIDAFATYTQKNKLHTKSATPENPRLILIGSVRDDTDEKLVYALRLLAHERGVKDSVDFVVNASWPTILAHLRTASIGVNGMWNEHFGIGVVEYQAAGLISVVHNSGGPRRDIVVPFEGFPTGFHAETEEEFANAFTAALQMSHEEVIAMRMRARKSAKRFTDEVFSDRWITEMEKLVALQKKAR